MAGLVAAENAVEAIMQCEGSITPCPGGIVASGSKPGADTYTFMQATTNQRFAPTLKDTVEDTNTPADVNAVYELVINGVDRGCDCCEDSGRQEDYCWELRRKSGRVQG